MTEPATTPDPLQARAVAYFTAVGESETQATAEALAEARVLVSGWCGGFVASVPKEVLDRAILEVAAELFYRKNSRNGVLDIAGSDLQPFRIARDPMKAAYPLLSQFIPGGLA